MSKRFLILAGIAMISVSCGQTGRKPTRPEMGSIEGIVRNARDAKPVPLATVKAGSEGVLTSSGGEFLISVPVGDYHITVTHDRYEDFRSPSGVKVLVDHITTYDVQLKPKKVEPPRARITRSPPPLTREKDARFAWEAGVGDPSGKNLSFAFFLEGFEKTFFPFAVMTAKTYPGLPDGKYVFKVKARDEDGEVEGPVVEHAFEVDSTPPLNPSVLPAGGEKFTGSRALEVICTVEGASEVVLWEEREPASLPWGPFRERKQFVLGTAEGEKTVYARFRDKAGNESETASFTIILDREPPSRPGGLRAKSLSSTEVRLTWNPSKDAGSGVESYTVLRDGIEIGKTRGTTYVDRRVRLGEEYSYSIEAVDRLKRSSDPSPSVEVSIRGRPPEKPSMPSPNEGATSQPTGLTQAWKGGDPDRGDSVTYDLYFGPNPTPPLRASGLTSPTFVLTGLEPSTKYFWRVEAKDAQGLETKGDTWSFTTAEKANSSPTALLTVTPTEGATTTRFRFDASASNDAEDAPSALVFRWDLDGDGKAEGDWSSDGTVLKSFAKIGSLTVTVEVKDTQGAVARASTRIEVKNSAPVLDGEPIPLNGATGENPDVKLSWKFSDPDPGDEILYDLYFGASEGKLKLVARGTRETAFQPAEPLKRGKVYYWRINARDSHGAVLKGPLWSFATAKEAVRVPFRAEVALKPKIGKTTTPFRFDASPSSDPDDPPEVLRIRWDWDGDGKADTDWTKEKHAVKTFDAVGVVRVGLEVQNSKGEIVTAFAEVTVENTPPSFVRHPTPKNGATGVEPDVALVWEISDPDPEDVVSFRVHFGSAREGMKVLAETLEKNSVKPSKKLEPGAYNWKVEAKDRHGGEAESPIWTFTVKERDNKPPLKPERPKGPDTVRFGREALFESRSKDPEGGGIRIRFDWGDGNVSIWKPAAQDGSLEQPHQYALQGDYGVKAQAIDPRQAESPWSDVHPISVLPPLKAGEEETLWFWDPALLQDLPDLFTVKLRYWFANLNGEGQWQGVGDPIAKLGFRSALGIQERTGAPWIHAEIGKYITAGVEYFVLEYRGSALIGAPARFGETTITVPTDVETSCSVRYGHFYFSFNPYLGPYFGGPYAGGGVKLGVGYFWNRTTLTPAGGNKDVETVEFPLPVIGIRLWGIVTKYFKVSIEFSYIEGSLQEADLRSGRLLEFTGDVLFTPIPYVGLSLGYRFTNVRGRIREGTGNLDTELNLMLDGFCLSLVAHF